MDDVWFIIGSSRGLGRNLTETVLTSGGRVAATARQPEQLAHLVAQFHILLSRWLQQRRLQEVHYLIKEKIKRLRKLA